MKQDEALLKVDEFKDNDGDDYKRDDHLQADFSIAEMPEGVTSKKVPGGVAYTLVIPAHKGGGVIELGVARTQAEVASIMRHAWQALDEIDAKQIEPEAKAHVSLRDMVETWRASEHFKRLQLQRDHEDRIFVFMHELLELSEHHNHKSVFDYTDQDVVDYASRYNDPQPVMAERVSFTRYMLGMDPHYSAQGGVVLRSHPHYLHPELR